jgi:hypothetical protein
MAIDGELFLIFSGMNRINPLPILAFLGNEAGKLLGRGRNGRFGVHFLQRTRPGRVFSGGQRISEMCPLKVLGDRIWDNQHPSKPVFA